MKEMISPSSSLTKENDRAVIKSTVGISDYVEGPIEVLLNSKNL